MRLAIKPIIVLVFIGLFFFSITAFASSNPQISVDRADAKPGSVIEVPVRLSGNTGICGAELSVSYDSALTLTKVTAGDALKTLTFTKSGNLSANPVVLLWDGMEEDSGNGIMAVLTFTVPKTNGTFDIKVSYSSGDIFDGSMKNVFPAITNGSVTVKSEEYKVGTPAVNSASTCSATSAKISWKKVSNVDGYEVFRSTKKKGTYSSVKIIKSGSTLSYKDTGLTCGKSYYYKIRAYKMVDGTKKYGDFSNVITACPVPGLVTITSAKSTSKRTAVLTWKKVADINGYIVFRSTKKKGSYKAIKTITSGKTLKYKDKGLTGKKTYYYRVLAYRTVNGKKIVNPDDASFKGVKVK